MIETKTIANKPVWIDLASPDPSASGTFYSALFGWTVEISADPHYGGYGVAKLDGKDVAGIGPKQSPEAPTAWTVYIGTSDADALAKKVAANGGTVVMPPFAVGDQGRMVVFQDPAGAFVSAWQATTMKGFQTSAPNTYGWAELNARGIEKALPFYQKTFGWTAKKSEAGEGAPEYTEFQLGGESFAGAMEMNPMVPAEMPSYWMAYFMVENVDQSFKKAIEAGGHEMLAPDNYPGGRFAIVSDPQGAFFGLMQVNTK